MRAKKQQLLAPKKQPLSQKEQYKIEINKKEQFYEREPYEEYGGKRAATGASTDINQNLAEEIYFCEGVGPIAMICHFA